MSAAILRIKLRMARHFLTKWTFIKKIDHYIRRRPKIIAKSFGWLKNQIKIMQNLCRIKGISMYKVILLITVIIPALGSNVGVSASEPKSVGVWANIKDILQYGPAGVRDVAPALNTATYEKCQPAFLHHNKWGGPEAWKICSSN